MISCCPEDTKSGITISAKNDDPSSFRIQKIIQKIKIFCIINDSPRGCLHGGRKILEGGSSKRHTFSVFSLLAKSCTCPYC